MGHRHKGDSLTVVRLIGVTGWKINGLAWVVQGWAEGAEGDVAAEGWRRDSRRILILPLSTHPSLFSLSLSICLSLPHPRYLRTVLAILNHASTPSRYDDLVALPENIFQRGQQCLLLYRGHRSKTYISLDGKKSRIKLIEF